MKRILRWAIEERIALLILLLAIGTILNSPPKTFIFADFFIYGVIIIAVLHLSHKLYLKLRKD